MSKYDNLSKILEGTNADCVPFTFDQIEAILGFDLPKSARTYRPWWSNDPKSHSQARAWVAAGYKTAEVNLEGETLTYVKAEAGSPPDAAPAHPVLGCMKDTVTVPEGVDVTEPAMPEWADLAQNSGLHNE